MLWGVRVGGHNLGVPSLLGWVRTITVPPVGMAHSTEVC